MNEHFKTPETIRACARSSTLKVSSPLLAAQARNETGIGIIIVPTKLLGEQTAQIASRCGLRALAINEDTVRSAYYENWALFNELADGKDVRVGVMSPQMLQSERMVKLLGNSKFKKSTRWILIDEAHLADEQSGTWRVSYKLLQTLNARLLPSTVWCAVTGTATPKRAVKIVSSLGLQSGSYVNARYSVDRHNVKYILLFFKNAVSGYEFLD
ncbi:hypothetical protein EIP86_000263 [Pleurotus ostreatoroseus]|nr:hypothetical protein EIP86_000263 [Pleurotus ostreatoroseus]